MPPFLREPADTVVAIYSLISAMYSSVERSASGRSRQADVMTCAKILLNTDVNVG